MTKPQSRARLAQVAGALLVIAVLMTACVAPSAPAGTPSAVTAPAPATAGPGGQATSPAATQAVQPATTSGPSAPFATAEPGSQEAGPSANLNPAAKFVTHYKGDPNAKVVIIEISDFQ